MRLPPCLPPYELGELQNTTIVIYSYTFLKHFKLHSGLRCFAGIGNLMVQTVLDIWLSLFTQPHYETPKTVGVINIDGLTLSPQQ